jgi:hydrogenase small subunit
VKSGHGCIACASSRFWDTKSPFYERLPHPAGFGVDVTAGEIGWTVVAGVAVATAAHAVGHVVRDHFHPGDGDGPPPEEAKAEKPTTEVH